MTPINSVIIEGAVLNNPREADGRLTFKLISARYTIQDGVNCRALSFFDVEAVTPETIKECKALDLSPGWGILVVGRMRTEESSGRHFVVIVAESVAPKSARSFRPENLPEVTQ